MSLSVVLNMTLFVALALQIASVVGENVFFPNATLGPKFKDFSPACLAALQSPINCDKSLETLIRNGRGITDNGVRGALCTTACGSSLSTYVDGTTSACNASQTIDGVPPAALGGRAYSMYNQTCLKDTATGQWCSDFLKTFSSNTDQDGTALPKELLCSNCATQLFQDLQASGFSSYDAGLAAQWQSVQQQCGTNFNTSVPQSGFPAPDPVVNQPETVCPAEQQYTVQQGETCNSIALAHGVAARQIINSNRLSSECYGLTAGTKLCLPPVKCNTYVLQAGDSCSSILGKTQMTSVSQLLAMNAGLYCNSLTVGEVICISPPGGQYTGTTISGAIGTKTGIFATATATSPGNVPHGTTMSCGRWYTVKSGDTCQLMIVASAISLDLFLAINPSVNKQCSNLAVGFSYCTSPTADWQSSMSNDTTTTAAPPGPTPSGTTKTCYTWHTIVSGDTCSGMATQFGVTIEQLRQLNTQLNTDCSNLMLGVAYCVSSSTSTATSTAAQATLPAPTSTPPGTTGSCFKWHTVVSGDSCWAIYSSNEITMDQLVSWNPDLKSDCSNLMLGVAYCVSGPKGSAKRAAIVFEESVADSRGGYPIGWPYPIRS